MERFEVKKYFKSLDKEQRLAFIDELLDSCESGEIFYVAKKLEECKKDFVNILPHEISERIFSFLGCKSLFECCKVN